ncbi:NADH-quinone oxidoreductase subunit 5 family protein [Desulfonatronovibrio hydrogenovorans]|uniref:NADH-quinone oxidoreductase subunit 5 family protein n=1 Tax=Desulfonatronovibrio hydrogenovorans TaxID=53245 RepID=UPI00054F1BF5|nr:proton-conducting transporter membrane subunit [Desulfonatronovibrio hydrogenovorans]
MNIHSLAALVILLPFFIAPAVLISNDTFRRAVIAGTAAALGTASLLMLASGPFAFEPSSAPLDWHHILTWADFILLGIILCIGLKQRNRLVAILVFLQILPLVLIKTTAQNGLPIQASLAADQLGLMMIIIVCVVGSLIAIYATEYMKVHSRTYKTSSLSQAGFFFFLILFLGAMNGLILSNNLLWMFFFWELTTLCSFVLIAHDGSAQALASAIKALWMNLLGGVFFIWAIYLLFIRGLPLEITGLTGLGSMDILMLPVALLCLAAFTKSAQLPFHSWLTGAMVAPAPVSALLHSSTMVNAGVFLILKLTPAYAGTSLALYLSIIGALTFISTSVLALTQNNAKKILAYSTIGSLGLIIACAGIGTPQAYGAAMLLILFHALAKGLLFMGVGHIEQMIKSKSIEDMWGLMGKYPGLGILMVLGMVSMFLPPFGALVSKWMAVHAAAELPIIVLMLALGSALSVVYWTRWAGLLLNSQECSAGSPKPALSLFISGPLSGLAILTLVLSFAIIPVYSFLVTPLILPLFGAPGIDSLTGHAGAFMVYPAFLVIGLVVLGLVYKYSLRHKPVFTGPYYAGLSCEDKEPGFVDPLGKFIPFSSKNYYFKNHLPEERISLVATLTALGFIILLVVGSL